MKTDGHGSAMIDILFLSFFVILKFLFVRFVSDFYCSVYERNFLKTYWYEQSLCADVAFVLTTPDSSLTLMHQAIIPLPANEESPTEKSFGLILLVGESFFAPSFFEYLAPSTRCPSSVTCWWILHQGKRGGILSPSSLVS